MLFYRAALAERSCSAITAVTACDELIYDRLFPLPPDPGCDERDWITTDSREPYPAGSADTADLCRSDLESRNVATS